MYSSRLPVPTSSVRRVVPGRMSNNVPPVLNLFTPQTSKIRHHTGAGASTGANKQRPSMAPERKFIKDPRPLADRAWQQETFDLLINFLSERQYPHPLPDAKKFFQSVSTTELARLFEFLISFFLSDFKIKRSIDQDVLPALKTIRYPFNVTKSNLVSVASRQSVAVLLGIFDWLIDMIVYMDKSRQDLNSVYPDSSNIAQLLMKMMIKSETDSDLEMNIREIADKIYGTEDDALELEIELERLIKEEIEIDTFLQAQKDADLVIENYQQDIESLRDYIEKMTQYNQVIDHQNETLQQEINFLEIEFQKSEISLSEMQAKVKNQLLKPEEIQWHLTEQERLSLKLREDSYQIEKLKNDRCLVKKEEKKLIDELEAIFENKRSQLIHILECQGFKSEDANELKEKLDSLNFQNASEAIDFSDYFIKKEKKIGEDADHFLKNLEEKKIELSSLQAERVALLNKNEEKIKTLKTRIENAKIKQEKGKLEFENIIRELDSEILAKQREEKNLRIQLTEMKENSKEQIKDMMQKMENQEKEREKIFSEKIKGLIHLVSQNRVHIDSTAKSIRDLADSVGKVHGVLTEKLENLEKGVEILRPHIRGAKKNN